MANCFFVSQNAMLTAVKNYNKSLEKLQDFFFKTKTKCSRPRLLMIQGQDQDFHFCPRGASRPRPWSRGLHHWLLLQRQTYRDRERGKREWPAMA